jgi:hypothetical protein
MISLDFPENLDNRLISCKHCWNSDFQRNTATIEFSSKSHLMSVRRTTDGPFERLSCWKCETLDRCPTQCSTELLSVTLPTSQSIIQEWVTFLPPHCSKLFWFDIQLPLSSSHVSSTIIPKHTRTMVLRIPSARPNHEKSPREHRGRLLTYRNWTEFCHSQIRWWLFGAQRVDLLCVFNVYSTTQEVALPDFRQCGMVGMQVTATFLLGNGAPQGLPGSRNSVGALFSEVSCICKDCYMLPFCTEGGLSTEDTSFCSYANKSYVRIIWIIGPTGTFF